MSLKVRFAHCAGLPRIVSHSPLLGSRDGCAGQALVGWVRAGGRLLGRHNGLSAPGEGTKAPCI